MIGVDKVEYAVVLYVDKCTELLESASKLKFSNLVSSLSSQVRSSLDALQQAYSNGVNSTELCKFKEDCDRYALRLEAVLPGYETNVRFRDVTYTLYKKLKEKLSSRAIFGIETVRAFSRVSFIKDKCMHICYSVTKEDYDAIVEIACQEIEYS